MLHPFHVNMLKGALHYIVNGQMLVSILKLFDIFIFEQKCFQSSHSQLRGYHLDADSIILEYRHY